MLPVSTLFCILQGKYIKLKGKNMPAKKVKKTKRSVSTEVSPVTAGSAVLFAGVAVVTLGNIQGRDNIKLLLIGFGAALLVLGGVLLGLAIKPAKKR